MALDNQRRCLLQHQHQKARLWDKLSPATSGGGDKEASKSSTGERREEKKYKNCCFSRVSSVERYLSAFENEMQERKKWQHLPESDSSWGFLSFSSPFRSSPLLLILPWGRDKHLTAKNTCWWQLTSTSFNLRGNKLNPLTRGAAEPERERKRKRGRWERWRRDGSLWALGLNSNCCCKFVIIIYKQIITR